MFLVRTVKNLRTARTMYKVFEKSRNNNRQPLRVVKFWEIYKAVRTR